MVSIRPQSRADSAVAGSSQAWHRSESSPDSPAKHTKFIAKYQLPFSLLADEDHKVCELYEVWGKKKMYGKEYDGVFRTTYIIGKDGKILKVFENVKPADHSAEILAVL